MEAVRGWPCVQLTRTGQLDQLRGPQAYRAGAGPCRVGPGARGGDYQLAKGGGLVGRPCLLAHSGFLKIRQIHLQAKFRQRPAMQQDFLR